MLWISSNGRESQPNRKLGASKAAWRHGRTLAQIGRHMAPNERHGDTFLAQRQFGAVMTDHPKKVSYFNRFLSSRHGSSSLERKTRAGLFRGSLRTCLVRGALRLSHQPIRQGRPLLQSLSSGDVCEEKLGICIFESLDAPGPRLCRRTFGSLARTCCWQCLALCFPVC